MIQKRWCALFLLLAGRALTAQTQVPDSAKADTTRRASDDSLAQRRAVALAPVRVTAFGASLNAARVPYSVSITRPSEATRAVPPLSLEEPLRGIAGLQLDNRNNIALGERLSIRGFGARTQFGVRGVRVDVDDVPATMPDGQTALTHVDPAAIGLVEVLRGPASALYGNAAGGVVRLRSASPLDAPFAVRAELGASERGTMTSRGSASSVIGGWSVDGHVSNLRYDGFRANSDAKDLRGGGRLVHAWTRDTIALTVAGVNYDAKNPGGLTDSARTADPRSASATNLRYKTGERGTHQQAGLSWRRGDSRSSLVATAYVLGRHIDNPIPQRIIDLGRRTSGARVAYDHALAPAGRDGSVSLGAEYAGQRDDRRSYVSLDGVRGTIALDQRERVGNDGVFARVAMPVIADLHFLGAVRADRVRFRVADRLVTATDPDDGGTRTMRAVSPSAGLSYALGDAANVYANVGTAFETPTTSELANQPDGAGGLNRTLQPQRVTSYEVGSRMPLASLGRLSLSAYDAEIRDALVPFELASSPGRQFFRNASRSRHRGIEADAALVLGARVSSRLAVSVVDARFVRDDFNAVSRAGKRVPGVAPSRLDMECRADLGMRTSFEVALRAQSRTPANDLGTAWSPGYALIDLRASGGRHALGAVGVSPNVSVSNVLDIRYDASLIANAARDRYFEPGPGRYVSVSVALDWVSARR
jgi:iron complex outermembrane receptor protein